MSEPGKEKKRFFAFATVCLTLVLLEVSSFFGVKILGARNPVIFFRPQVVSQNEYAHYLRERDTLVGWPSPSTRGNGYYDADGSRMIPAFPDPQKDTTVVSLYGDSMTHSLGVDSMAAWSNQLSIMIGGRVANYGKAGFGSDQALLYFLRNTNDRARIVFFNHFSQDVLRNVTQFLALFAPGTGHELGFKPRFIADGARLTLVPLPTMGYDAYAECCTIPSKYLKHEFFIPDDGVSGVQSPRFPYTLTLVRLYRNHVVKPKLQGVPRHMEFYEPAHPSNALRVTELIMKEFHKEALRRKRIPVLSVIPDGKDLEYFLEHRQWSYQPLKDSLESDGLEVLDFGPRIVEKLHGRSPCSIITECYNHFNEEGYRLVAEIAYEYLRQKELLKEIGRQGPEK